MKRITQRNREIYCMFCTKSTPDGPRENQLLIDLLWQKYLIKYNADVLLTINFMSTILINEIDCRVIHLKSLIDTLKRNLTSSSPAIDNELEQSTLLIHQLESLKTQLNELDERQLNDYSNRYAILLTGECETNRPCEYFIRRCEQLLYYNHQIVFEKYFPLLQNRMNEWEETSMTTENFQPKILDAYRALEGDLGRHIYPSIPYRIGLIGNISVGKTSLLNWLRTQTKTDDILISPVRVGKSTYCRLEFEHKYPDGKKIILVDIEGSTDIDRQLKSANYYDEISKADCDLYLIVFDNQFTDIQHGWKEFIEGTLKRQCWLVRNKIDDLFQRKCQENLADSKYKDQIFEQIRNETSIDIHGNRLSNVYLTYVSQDDSLRDKTDLDRLLTDIQQLPTNVYNQRLHKMALCAMARVINNCFRRGYVINIMKFKIAAGIAAVVPFCDLIARYYGREEIRQAFGITTRSRLSNRIYGTTNEFEDYLNRFEINIDGFELKTSIFKGSSTNNLASVAAKSAAVGGAAGVSVCDDVLRASGAITTTAVRGLSVAIVAAGAVLTVGMCTWAAVSNGKHLYEYLNGLCDDLICISNYLTAKMISDNNEIRDTFS